MAEGSETAVYTFPSAAVVLVVSLLYGLIFSMMIGAIMLFARFMSDKPLWLKITAAVLWPVTYICIGMVMYAVVPYWIYNTVKMFMREKEPEIIWTADNYSSLAEQSAAQQAIEQPAAESAPAIEAAPESEPAPKSAPVAEAAPESEPAPESEAAPESESAPAIEAATESEPAPESEE